MTDTLIVPIVITCVLAYAFIGGVVFERVVMATDPEDDLRGIAPAVGILWPVAVVTVVVRTLVYRPLRWCATFGKRVVRERARARLPIATARRKVDREG